MINRLALLALWSVLQQLNRVSSVQFSYVAPYTPEVLGRAWGLRCAGARCPRRSSSSSTGSLQSAGLLTAQLSVWLCAQRKPSLRTQISTFSIVKVCWRLVLAYALRTHVQ